MKHLFIILLFFISSLNAEENKITSLNEIINNYLPYVEDYLKLRAEMKNDSYSREFALSEIEIKKKDINKDGKVDYYISVPTWDCGSSGCTGTLYISFKNNYCLAGSITPNDFEKPNIKSLKCRNNRKYYDYNEK